MTHTTTLVQPFLFPEMEEPTPPRATEERGFYLAGCLERRSFRERRVAHETARTLRRDEARLPDERAPHMQPRSMDALLVEIAEAIDAFHSCRRERIRRARDRQ